MKIAMNLQHLISIFAGFLFLALPALAVDNYKEFKRDHLTFDLASQFFYSDANYTSFSTSPQPSLTGYHYQLLDVTLEARYAPQANWSVFAWANIGNAESETFGIKRTNSSINQSAMGADLLVYSGFIDLIPEVAFIAPLEAVDPLSTTVLNNEGVFEARSRLVAQKDFGFWRAYSWLGFTYRAEGRSFLMPYGLGLQMKYDRMRLGAEIIGSESVTSDSNNNVLVRSNYINNINGASLKFYSVDPSLIDSLFYLNWRLTNKWTVQLNGGLTLAGENSASGYHVGGFLRYDFDFSNVSPSQNNSSPVISKVPPYRSNMHNQEQELSSEKKVEDFHEDTNDGVDQNIFKPQPTPKAQNVDTSIQQQLDSAEFQVELKAKKNNKNK